jgi:hypothetical protein
MITLQSVDCAMDLVNDLLTLWATSWPKRPILKKGPGSEFKIIQSSVSANVKAVNAARELLPESR